MRKLFFALTSVLLLSFQTAPVSVRFYNDMENAEYPAPWINVNTRHEGPANSGSHFSRTDSVAPYGLGVETEIPVELKNKNTRLSIKAALRVNNPDQKIFLVTTISKNDSSVFWQGENVAQKFGKAMEWSAINSSLLIPRNLPPGSKVKVFLWNQDGKAEADIDDMEVIFSSVETPSYLPR